MSHAAGPAGTNPGDPIPVESQAEHWDRVAWSKSFSHPLRFDLLSPHLPGGARVLDYGCGYGRVGAELQASGLATVVGIDTSAEMIRRGRTESPELDLRQIDGLPLPDELGRFDAVLLFAVLTCIPALATQRRLMAVLHQLLRPAGIVYISDFYLQEDERNRRRYAANLPRFSEYGVFELPEGMIVRHLERAWLPELTRDFTPLAEHELDLQTMNCHPAVAFQYLGRRQDSRPPPPGGDRDGARATMPDSGADESGAAR